MHIVIFGLTISSSWANGHATLWRSLVKAILRRGHTLTYYEKDVPYYALERDLDELPLGAKLVLYRDFDEVRRQAKNDLAVADLAMSTSFCPDGIAASALILETCRGIRAFYDLDTPVTLDLVRSGGDAEYLPANGLADFDVVLSYTGGKALEELKTALGARVVFPWYGSVDPDNHYPVAPREEYRATLSYLGTYAADRQLALSRLFLDAARRMQTASFLIGGSQYPDSFPWQGNIRFVQHVPPPLHPSFFCSSRATLNVTRGVMARYGFCPSGRLFEAAACGVPLLTDLWEGLDTFFTLGLEILPVNSLEDVLAALALSDEELRLIAKAARERTLAEHTGDSRVRELESICDGLRSPALTAHCV